MKLVACRTPTAKRCNRMIESTAKRHWKAHGKVPSWIYVSIAFIEAIGVGDMPVDGALLIHGIVCVRNPKIEGVACYSVNAREGMTL